MGSNHYVKARRLGLGASIFCFVVSSWEEGSGSAQGLLRKTDDERQGEAAARVNRGMSREVAEPYAREVLRKSRGFLRVACTICCGVFGGKGVKGRGQSVHGPSRKVWRRAKIVCYLNPSHLRRSSFVKSQ